MSYQRNSIPNRLESPATPVETPISTSKTNRTAVDIVASDTVHVYCTEDTPADISPVGSQSNLSALSMPSVQEDVEKIEPDNQSAEIDCHRSDLFDESSNLSGEDEKILDECIQSGIPKVLISLIEYLFFISKGLYRNCNPSNLMKLGKCVILLNYNNQVLIISAWFFCSFII